MPSIVIISTPPPSDLKISASEGSQQNENETNRRQHKLLFCTGSMDYFGTSKLNSNIHVEEPKWLSTGGWDLTLPAAVGVVGIITNHQIEMLQLIKFCACT